MIYLDYNATTPIDERVLSAMLPYLKEEFGNPSSIYSLAQRARRAVEEAREKLAKLLNADPKEIIFTSGGTESDNFAIKGIAYANQDKGKHIITSQIEHHAVLNTCKFLEKQGFHITYLPVDRYGVVDLDALEKSITPQTILISIMFANNEVGTIQPIKKIGEIAKRHGVYFHTDAVQAVGKIPIDVKELGIDLLSLSAHKFYGPKGVGALYVRKGVKMSSFIQGGEQERGRRGGTENVAGIVGLGKAAEIAQEEMVEEEKRVRALRDELERRLLERIPEVVLNGHPQNRLYNTLSICVKYVEGESMLINLDREGICASSGSACTSGSLEPSHVLLAMGVPPEIAHGSLRFSLGKFNREEDVERVSEVLPSIVEELRKISPFWE
jgi:cysteine desulfurase